MLSDEKRKTAVVLTATELKSQGSLNTHEGMRVRYLKKEKKKRDSAHDIRKAKHFKGGKKNQFRVCVCMCLYVKGRASFFSLAQFALGHVFVLLLCLFSPQWSLAPPPFEAPQAVTGQWEMGEVCDVAGRWGGVLPD